MAFLNNAGLERLWAHIILKLNHKVDKVEGKGLSTEDFTTEEKEKLAGLGAAQVQADWDQTDETAKDYIKNKPDEEDALAVLMETGFITPVANTDGSVFTDGNGALYSL